MLISWVTKFKIWLTNSANMMFLHIMVHVLLLWQIYVHIWYYICNGGAGPLPQVHGVRVCTYALARCRVVIAKVANQNVRLPVFGRFG